MAATRALRTLRAAPWLALPLLAIAFVLAVWASSVFLRGVLDLRDVLYFVLTIVAWLVATVLVIEIRKAD